VIESVADIMNNHPELARVSIEFVIVKRKD
jgi:hypothetical protein